MTPTRPPRRVPGPAAGSTPSRPAAEVDLPILSRCGERNAEGGGFREVIAERWPGERAVRGVVVRNGMNSNWIRDVIRRLI